MVTAGAGLLFRFIDGYQTAGRDGEYIFNGTGSFAQGLPEQFAVSIDRLSPTPRIPDYNRSWQYVQSYFFVQDSFRVTPRFTLNFGLRYERFGEPANTGSVKDDLLQLGAASSFTARLASANVVVPGSGNEQIFGADNKDFAPRFGFAWDVFGKSKTLLRGGFGIFMIGLSTISGKTSATTTSCCSRIRSVRLQLPHACFERDFIGNLQYADAAARFSRADADRSRLRNGYSQSSFVGVQQQLRENLTFEVNGTSALGRRLITTDIVNRAFTVPSTIGALRPNQNLPDVSWRSDQGISDYYAMSSLVRYRVSTLLLQAAYTWSHSIDNQSDPLTGDFFDLNFSAIGANQERARARLSLSSSTAMPIGRIRSSISATISFCWGSGNPLRAGRPLRAGPCQVLPLFAPERRIRSMQHRRLRRIRADRF